MWAPWVAARVLVALAFVLAGAIAAHFVPGAQIDPRLTAWDGAFYQGIADVGYQGLTTEALRFFPLYPLVGRAVAVAFGGNAAVGLLLVGNVASFGAAIVMRRLVLFERNDPKLADRAVWLTCLFPASFVLVWAYAEALFLVLAIATFLAARRGRFGLAAALAFAAALTRPVGVLLAAPIAIEAWRSWRAGATTPMHIATRLVAISAPVLGIGAYLAWVGREFGDPRLPLTVQNTLRGSSDPVSRLMRGLGDLVGDQRFADGLHVPFAFGFVFLVVVVARKWPASYSVYAGLSMLVALSAQNLNSIERYALDAFPLLLAIADLTTTVRRERITMAVCATGLLSLCSLAWLRVYVP